MKAFGIISTFGLLALTATSISIPSTSNILTLRDAIPDSPHSNLLPRNDDDNRSEVQDQESSRDSSGGFVFVPITSNPNEKYPYTLWTYRVQSLNLDSCPPLAGILATIAVSNFLTNVISSSILGFSAPMNLLTFTRFSKNRPSQHLFLFIWLPIILLYLAAHCASAALSKNASNWRDFPLFNYAIFLFTLPRSGWFSIFYLAKKNKAYLGALNATLVSEFIAATAALYSMIQTIRAVSLNNRGLLSDGKTPKLLPGRLDQQETMTRVMLVGVTMFLMSYISMVIIYLLTIFSRRIRKREGWGIWQAATMGGVWAGSWVYWGGFTVVMAREYCPAFVYAQGAIIAVFGVLGMYPLPSQKCKGVV